MADAVIGTSYLKVIPKMDTGTLRSELDSAGKSAGKSAGSVTGAEMADGMASSISAKAVVLGNVVTEAIRGAVSGAVDVGREIVGGIYDGFSANEQFVGGMKKLFGDNAQTVIDNANNAFMTAGASANDYMEGVTSFASSLVKSVGGDTAEAARLADVAMTAMSDNVNTFGTDAQSVQNAIQGMAKGNFSMLDNLSLGFAGTQQGMVDLINASGVLDHQLTDTKDLANVGFGTMVEAIQAVQENMGIAGTTAKEAMGTLEGSATAASAAWQNVLTSIGTGDSSQVQSAVDGLIDAYFGAINAKTGQREGGVIQNVVGLAQRSFDALAQALPGMLDSALNALPPEVGGPLREAFEAIGTVVTTVAPIVTTAISGIVTAVGTIAPVVAPLLPIIASVLGAVKIAGVITTIVGAVGGFITAAGTAIGMIGSLPGLIAVVTTALGGPVTIIAAIVGAIVAFIATNEDARKAVVEVWTTISTAITSAASAAVDFVTDAWSKLTSGAKSAFDALKSTVTSVWSGITSAASTAAASLVNSVTSKLRLVVNVARTIFAQVKNAIMTPINAARDAVRGAIDRIKSIINGAHLSLPHFALPHFRINGGQLPWGIGGKGSPPSINVDWYARGGWVDGPTLFGAGERGGEFIWPSYAPYLDRYADALSARMGGGGVTVNLTYNGSGDADELVSLLTRDLRMMRMTGAI